MKKILFFQYSAIFTIFKFIDFNMDFLDTLKERGEEREKQRELREQEKTNNAVEDEDVDLIQEKLKGTF